MALAATIKNEVVSIGDTVRVAQIVAEEGKKRTQYFEGVVISIKGAGSGRSFTVRKIGAYGIGVERIWPVVSPTITGVKKIKGGKVRRSKLYYMRTRTGKLASKIKEEAPEKRTSEGTLAAKKKPRKKG